jgi:hypothetical protein
MNQTKHDRLARVRERVRQLRDLEAEINDLEGRLSDLNKTYKSLTTQELVDLLQEAGIDHLGLPAEGNLPAYMATLSPYYGANIAASWDISRKQAAFDWLNDHGAGDLIKAQVTINLPRGELNTALKLNEELQKKGFEPSFNMSVSHQTLTAFVREQLEKGEILPLETLGANVGQVVKLKERK